MKRRGAVMVITLAVLAGLVAVLAAAAASQRVAFRAGLNRIEERRAAITADSACQYVMSTLATQSKTAFTPQDPWLTLGTAGEERFTFGDQSFRIEVVDAASRVNLNTVTAAQLQQMNLTPQQVDSLQDWRQAGQTPRANGAKDAYYNSLPVPYNTALRPFHSVDELLLVQGFTANDLFGTIADQEGSQGTGTVVSTAPTTTSINGNQVPTPILYDMLTVDSVSQDLRANGQPKIGINSAGATLIALVRAGIPVNLAAAIVQRRTSGRRLTSMSALLGLPGVTTRNAATLLNNLSVTGVARVTGKLDLNTVTPDVLNTIPNMSADVVQAITQQQATGFTSLGQLASLPGMTIQNLQPLADLFSVNTQSFIVRIIAEAGSTQKAYEATINIEGTTPKVVRMTEAPAGAEARWGWSSDASQTTPIDSTTMTTTQ